MLPAAIAALLLAATASADELFPRPEALDPNVRFWVRVYTEVDGAGGLIHDAEHLEVVYEVVRFKSGLGERARERLVGRTKDGIRTVLKRLARGKRTDLSAEEAAVLGRWPEGVSNRTLARAAKNLRFQLGQADKFRAGLIRSGAWIDFIETSLRDEGVPTALAALPHVESSYNPRAYSRVGAAGLWQFTRSTGRRYLRVDHVVDERLDPYKASAAAARLLRDNYRTTGTWPLAITAYNHGAAGMRRAARRLGTRDIGRIVREYRSRSFGFASRNFYASFLAAREVDSAAERYFGPLSLDAPVDYDSIELPHYYPATSLARALRVEVPMLRQHNPALRPAVWNGAKYVPRGFALRIPRAMTDEAPETLLARIPEGERLAQQHRDRYYKVQRGDTLSRIAQRFSVRERELVALNNLKSRNRIRVGQVIVLPDDAGGAPAPVPSDGIYRVRRGDTVSRIASRFGVMEAELVSLNGLRNRHHLTVGQRLKLPGAAPGPRPSVTQAKTEPPTQARPKPTKPMPATDTSEVAAYTPPSEIRRDPTFALEQPMPATEATLPDLSDETISLDYSARPAPSDPATPKSERPHDPSDYAVDASGRITVQASETLGHYAEWLELSAGRLRHLNGMRYGNPLVIDSRIKLDLGRVDAQEFERRRLAYHRTLQEEFFEAYLVTGTEEHVLRKGDTLWYLAKRKYRLPVWLLRQYNPDLDFAALPPGERLVVPRVAERVQPS